MKKIIALLAGPLVGGVAGWMNWRLGITFFVALAAGSIANQLYKK